MTISMYTASIPVFVRMLNNLAKILDKAATHAEAKKIDPSVLLNYRLAPDMFPLTKQIQIVTDNAKGMAARLSGQDIPKYEDNETTIAELQARIRKTLDFMASIAPEQIDGQEDREVTLKLPKVEHHFTGINYLLNFAIPNFYFHVSMAYSILRHAGVDIGKMDYLGTI